MVKNILKVSAICFLIAGVLLAFFFHKRTIFHPKNTSDAGVLKISADESFQPVIDEQLKVFSSQNPYAKVSIVYKPESECIKDLLNDVTRMILISRKLTLKEQDFMRLKWSYVPKFELLAYDAIAVVVHPKALKKQFTLKELGALLKGDNKTDMQAVMDGTKATATVRYLLDELIKAPSFPKGVLGSQESKSVLNYVSMHPKAIGFVGLSWVVNQEKSDHQSFLKKVSVAALESTDSQKTVFLKPSHTHILSGKYPWIRPIYYVVKENYAGIGRAFANFMRYEKGQLIFKKAQLAPARIPFHIRNARLHAL